MIERNKVLLLILDGFGLAKPGSGNAIALEGTSNINRLIANNPHTTLNTSGLAVGLPEGQMGNSEVGHLNLGAGKIVYQKLTLINRYIENGLLDKNKDILAAINSAKNSKLHLAGLCSDGGVHSMLEHLYAIVKIAKENGINNLFIHAFLDGRDTPPKSGIDYVQQIENHLKEIECGSIATICGRYFGMDRDKRWDRVKLAYDCLTLGQGRQFKSAMDAVQFAYDNDETDEFVKPSIITKNGKPLAIVDDGDSFIHFNFRPDRARELTKALTDPNFTDFERRRFPKIKYTCFAQYDESFDLPIIFTEESLNQNIEKTLGSIVSEAGLRQLRIAETEKYAHVTYFLNGGREEPFPGEDRIMVQSPKVATYDLKPEMSAPEVEEKLKKAIENETYDLIVCNLANCDMVGHTGVIDAAIKAIRQVDESTDRIVQKAHEHGYDVVVVSDHGNAEQMLDKNGGIETAHSMNPVPLIMVTSENRKQWVFEKAGILSDVTGLILYLLGLQIPKEMKQSVLIPSF